MKDIEIYSSDDCPYCQQAKRMLKKESLRFKEIKITMKRGQKVDDFNFKQMKKRTLGQSTVPQIFIGGEYYGDDDTLARDIKTRKLKAKLS